MTGTLNTIAAAIAQQISDALNSSIAGVQVEPEVVLNPTPPTIDIYPADPFLEANAFGLASYDATYVVRVRVSPADQVGAQQLVIDLLDPTNDESLVAALRSDATFDGTVSDSGITTIGGFIVYDTPTGGQISGASLLGAELRLTVVVG